LRSGLTVLEFVGCVIAVLGGAWIGALFLGINVQHVAHTALHQAQLLEKVPPQWRPEGPQQNAVTREQLVTTLRKELGTLRSEIQALRGQNPGDVASAAETAPDATAGALNSTRAYWARLNEIALGEDDLQRDAGTAVDDANAAKVFAIKSRVSRFAAKGVEALPSEGVDAAVVKFGRQLALWYGKADELYERAVRIWETSGSPEARLHLTDEWKRDEFQHRQEARLIRERAGILRASLSRQFGEEFPEFATPAVAAEASPPAENGVTAD
jgi:hypothetical protein